MRHRRKGRVLGRSPKHQRALLRSLASALLLTERDAEFDENAPKVKGRIVTTVSKAKEVRPLVEKCITIARRSLAAQEAAVAHGTSAERGSQEWKSWRTSENWVAWNQAIAPAVAARRRCIQLLGDPQAVRILFDDIAPRFADRPGGYTRIIRLARPRLGDAGPQAILEFVGVRDRIAERSEKPSFEDDAPAGEEASAEAAETEEVEAEEQAAATDDDTAGDESAEKKDAE
ncbi:MAG: 50S ribosomal protein L17 [Planctomycetes bacterium]|nr:50S ribosomal protein L17 [Planctomycetota bacterium]